MSNPGAFNTRGLERGVDRNDVHRQAFLPLRHPREVKVMKIAAVPPCLLFLFRSLCHPPGSSAENILRVMPYDSSHASRTVVEKYERRIDAVGGFLRSGNAGDALVRAILAETPPWPPSSSASTTHFTAGLSTPGFRSLLPLSTRFGSPVLSSTCRSTRFRP